MPRPNAIYSWTNRMPNNVMSINTAASGKIVIVQTDVPNLAGLPMNIRFALLTGNEVIGWMNAKGVTQMFGHPVIFQPGSGMSYENMVCKDSFVDPANCPEWADYWSGTMNLLIVG